MKPRAVIDPEGLNNKMTPLLQEVHDKGLSLSHISVSELLMRWLVECYVHQVKLETKILSGSCCRQVEARYPSSSPESKPQTGDKDTLRGVSMWKIRREVNPSSERAGKVHVAYEDMSKSYSMPINFVHGVPYPMSCWESRWGELSGSIKYRKSDILIATYPKCGTTWIEQVVLLLLSNGETSKLNPATKNSYDPSAAGYVSKIWPEACLNQLPEFSRMGAEFKFISLEQFEAMPTRRVLKTHAPVHLLLGTQGKGVAGLPREMKVIVVTRNPLDACVSCYYHGFNPFKSGWPFSAWATLWLHGEVPHGSWFDWVKGWWTEKQRLDMAKESTAAPAISSIAENYRRKRPRGAISRDGDWAIENANDSEPELEAIRDKVKIGTRGHTIVASPSDDEIVDECWPQIHWIQYENLKHHGLEEVERLASFLGLTYASREEYLEVLRRTYEGSTIESMKAQAQNQKEGQDGVAVDVNHIRKGTVGDWRYHFSESEEVDDPGRTGLYEAFHKMFEDKMKGTGLTYVLDSETSSTDPHRWEASV